MHGFIFYFLLISNNNADLIHPSKKSWSFVFQTIFNIAPFATNHCEHFYVPNPKDY